MDQKTIGRIPYIAFAGIACLSILLRLYKINAPIADWHSFRQSDTASVARIYVREGIDLLHPRYDDLSNVQSGKDNPEGWRMVEFPIYQGISAWFAIVFPFISIEIWLRIVSILSSTAAGILLGILLWSNVNPLTGLFASLLWAVLPFNVFYGRCILPENLMMFFVIACIFFLNRAFRYKTIGNASLILSSLSVVFGALSLLTKPTAIFLLFPLFGYGVMHWKWNIRYIAGLFIYAVILILPLFLWRNWIRHFSEGIPFEAWVLNYGNIRFKGAWFYWLFAERIGKLILGYWGLIPFGFGCIVSATKRDLGIGGLWIVGSLLYLVIFASGNVRHDYYQMLLLPVICFYTGKGLAVLFEAARDRRAANNSSRQFGRYSSFGVALVSLLFSLAFSWYTIRSYYWINHPEIVEAGKKADMILPKNAKVIAPYQGDTAFLYQINRPGWPVGYDIEKKIQMGATHYVSVYSPESIEEAKMIEQTHKVIVKTDTYSIVELTKDL